MKDERREKRSARPARPPVGAGERFRRFELKTPLASNNWPQSYADHATAYQQSWDGSIWQTIVDSRAEFTVYDEGLIHIGRGRDDYPSPYDRGSQGLARWDGHTDRWVIVWMQPAALCVLGYAIGPQTASSGGLIDGVRAIAPAGSLICSSYGIGTPGVSWTFTNPFQLATDNDGLVFCVPDYGSQGNPLIAVQMTTPTVY